MKKLLFVLMAIATAMCLTLAACGMDGGDTSESTETSDSTVTSESNVASDSTDTSESTELPATYTVTFQANEAGYGTVSQTSLEDVEENTAITMDGATLTIGETTVTATPASGDAQYTYAFANWTAAESVTGNIVVTANFTRTVNTYTVTWKDENGDVLETDSAVAYGTTPTYDGETPAKDATAENTYTFAGWTPAVAEVTGNVEYVATYSSTVKTYTITWKNDDGSTLKTDTLAYGATPAYTGDTPTKAATAQYSYSFAGWTPALAAVTGNAEYTAEYDNITNKYTVVWKNHDGTTLETDNNVSYGYTASYDGATPTKAATAQYTYTFSGWTPEVTAVAGNQEYTATFSETVNKYTVTFNMDGGDAIEPMSVDYGTPASALASLNPTRSGYAFSKWQYDNNGWVDLPAEATVTSDITLKAVWSFIVPEGALTYNGGTVLDYGRTGDGLTASLNLQTLTTVNGDYEVSFGSENSAVVAVDSNGVATPVAGGTADIYATVNGTKTALTTITVHAWTAIAAPADIMALNTATASGYYYLTADLDMTGCCWKTATVFTGVLDGNYHIVSNLSKQPGNWSGNSVGGSIFFSELTEGSELKNIAFVNYLIFAIYEGDGVTPLGMATNSGFVQTNNGTMENVVVMMERNKNYSSAWEQAGFGAGNGTILAFTNNGTIRNCVAHNVSGGMTYSIVGRNTGTVDNVYGFFEVEDDDPSTPNVVNKWSDWRGTYNLSVVWTPPFIHEDTYYGFHDISNLFGCDNIDNPQATNSALLSGYNDAALAGASFNESFKALVNGCFNSLALAKNSLGLTVDETLDISAKLGTTLTAQADVSVEYAVADTSIATVSEGNITGAAVGTTTLYVKVTYGGKVYKTIAVEVNVVSFSAIYSGKTALDVNRSAENGGVLSINLAENYTLSDSSSLNDHTISYLSSNADLIAVSVEGVATIANEATSGSATIYVVIDGVQMVLTTIDIINWTAISTPAEFAALGPVITEAMGWRLNQTGYYYLTADLDMSQVTDYTWSHWTTFTGILDGNYHVVSNLVNPGVTYVEGLDGAGAFIGTLTAGSAVRNIGFVNYVVTYGADQAGFVQVNNGTIENVLFMVTRDVNSVKGWLEAGMGLVNGSALTWINNGTIKNVVVHHLTGSEENYAIVAANNAGTIDGAYGFVELDDGDGDRTNNVINVWSGWRGTYNIGLVWTQPEGGDFGSITNTIGVAGSNAPTNSAVLTGFNDEALANASFNESFEAMVNTYYHA